MAEFRMPSLGADMEAGTLLAWRKKPGDSIRRGDIIAEVETDKAAIEVESFLEGTLEQILVQPGDKVPIGTALARIRSESEPEAPSAAPAPAPALAALPVGPIGAPEPARLRAGLPQLRVTPVARRLAEKLGVDLTLVVGSGPSGRIQERDVEQAAARPAVPQEMPQDRQARMRQAIAAAMARSNREIPHFYLQTTIDMHAALKWLEAENRKRSVAGRLLYSVLLIKSVAGALREVPELNAVWAGDHLEIKTAIHVGVAVMLRGGGLMAPALHDTDRLTVDEVMEATRDLVRRVRTGGLRSSELTDPTITVTNLGEEGADTVLGLIYPPQVALVGFGRIVERPWVVGKRIMRRPLLNATLAADHRAVDGHLASTFLAAVDRLLQDPKGL